MRHVGTIYPLILMSADIASMGEKDHCKDSIRGDRQAAPVMWHAAEEQRNTAAMAMSHLEPTRPMGMVDATSSFTSSSDASTPASFCTPEQQLVPLMIRITKLLSP